MTWFILLFILLDIPKFSCATQAAFPAWARPRVSHRRFVSAGPPNVTDSNLTGSLFYATCDLPSCDTLEFATLDLATGAKTDLFDFPLDSFEDAYVADDVVIGSEVTISLNYDSDPSWGYLLVFDLSTRKIVRGRNSSSCFALWENPAEPQTSLLCLNLVPKGPSCPPGTTTQCTLLKSIDRGTGAEHTIAGLLPDYAPFTVEALDTATGLIYAAFELLSGGNPELVSIDARTGKIVNTATFRYSLAFIELEYSSRTGGLYAVVQDTGTPGKPLAYAGKVNPITAVPTPLGPRSYFNVSFPPATGGYFNQFNTISTLSDELGVFFSTAFHYAVPSPPSDPILHLLGNSLVDGELVYDEVVANPFCEILWLPSSKFSVLQQPAASLEVTPPSTTTPLTYTCSSSSDCNYNGDCGGDSACNCRAPWTGEGCDVLDLDPGSLGAGLGYQWVDPVKGEAVSSWGGSVLLDNSTGV